MKNLDQIRAASALPAAESLGRSAVNKLPAMILQNGLLATAAFCESEGGGEVRKQMKDALDATVAHLNHEGIPSGDTEMKTGLDLIKQFSNRDSRELQRVTAEALAYLAYLKRFSTKE